MIRLLFLLLLVLPPRYQAAAPVILSPLPGEVLQGVVSIRGTSFVDGFVSAEIAFSYLGDPTGTWFPLTQTDRPVQEGELAIWDTNGISDGDYTLRLRVVLQDGAVLQFQVDELRVRNYTAVDTPMPSVLLTPTAAQVAPQASPTLLPTPTPLPSNPLEVRPADLARSAILGGLSVLILLGLLVLYLWLRWRRT